MLQTVLPIALEDATVRPLIHTPPIWLRIEKGAEFGVGSVSLPPELNEEAQMQHVPSSPALVSPGTHRRSGRRMAPGWRRREDWFSRSEPK